MCDIVCTNPPFSLFREYLPLLVKHNKKFLVLGNYSAATYSIIRPMFSDRKVWIGASPRSMDFYLPNGKMKTVNAVWFTNLAHSYQPSGIPLEAVYNELQNPKYDNYDAIEVSSVKDIPRDYEGLMGVPITFMDKFNPRQFEIVDYLHSPFIEGNEKFKRFIIKAKPGFIPPKPPSKTVVEKRKRKAGLRKQHLMNLYAKQDGKCANPKCPHNEYQEYFHPDFMDLDHIVPVSKGGSDELVNLQLLCRKCNNKKSDKTVQENSDI